MQNTSEIVINGRRYDAHTGERVDKPARLDRTVASSHMQRRQTARHLRAHTPSSSRLLMRQAVKKPAARTRIKVSGELAVQNPAKPAVSIQRLEARLDRAKQIKRSRSLTHFAKISASPEVKRAVVLTPALTTQPVELAPVVKSTPPQTTNEFLEAALQAATAHEQKPLPKPRRHAIRRRLFGHSRAHAV